MCDKERTVTNLFSIQRAVKFMTPLNFLKTPIILVLKVSTIKSDFTFRLKESSLVYPDKSLNILIDDVIGEMR